MVGSLGTGNGFIKHAGVVEVENAEAEPTVATEHFPPANVIYIGNMTQSQIQQGVTSSTQTGTFLNNDPQAIRDFVSAYKSKLPEMSLSPSERQEAEAEIATVEAQLGSSKPKWGIIQASCEVLKGFLAHVGGSAIASYFKTLFPTL